MLEIFWSDRYKIGSNQKSHIKGFMDSMSKRYIQGHCRYGDPSVSKKYMDRLDLELKAYRKTGNREHLINAANYCMLEDFVPSNTKYHFDNTGDSATRGKI